MVVMNYVKGALVLGPIIALLAMGLWLTLRSGVANLYTHQGLRQLVGNVSQTVFLLGGYLLVLAILQHLVGFHLGLM